jgi:hypothetical protein
LSIKRNLLIYDTNIWLYGENIYLNEPRLGLKKKSGVLETKNRSDPNIFHFYTSILTKIIHMIGLNYYEIKEFTLPETRKAYNSAQIGREVAIGAAVNYIKKGYMNR